MESTAVGISRTRPFFGQRGTEIFAAARAKASYLPETFRLIISGQAVNLWNNGILLDNVSGHDTFAVGPYILFEANDTINEGILVTRTFVEARDAAATGYLREHYNHIRKLEKPVPMAVYEVNLHTTKGNIPQDSLHRLTPSAGAGVAIANHMLTMLGDLQMRDQCFYNLKQYHYYRPDQKSVRLWGSIVDLMATKRKRPQFLTLQMCNMVLKGDMVQTRHEGRLKEELISSWVKNDFTNGDQLCSYGFRDGNQYGLIVINLNLSNRIPLTFQLAAEPEGPAERFDLTFTRITDTNEDEEMVRIERTEETNFGSGATYTIRQGGLTVWRWKGSGADEQGASGSRQAESSERSADAAPSSETTPRPE